jgi:O-antigen/teichoic acid export membrane protein
MWFIFQGIIIFAVFCWIGEYVPLHEGHNARAAAGYGGIAAFLATLAIVYAIDYWRRFLHWLTRPRPPKALQWKPKTGRELVREYQTVRRH